ncbi:amidohydrolase [Fusibacter ferrireducens]|uniref:Amidohydrolase n=1 Tax=Fusibacter ferrireducens TaxID=2785058 RepID=A0ABR9ZRI7_9FIRM|nr:amidohydrolase [Fusibacter ferrireducens]MBF4693067.1 amidohydrolase [Fusibacter ferrireducens]
MQLHDSMIKEIEKSKDKIIENRRLIHQYPEVGWTEIKTAALVARELESLGFKVSKGDVVISSKARMGVPNQYILDQHYAETLALGYSEAELQPFKDGFTGVVGEMKFGEGPTIALRFDMDAIGLEESLSTGRGPVDKGFVSQIKGQMHGCGHDGHTAIGLGVAESIAKVRHQLNKGSIKLIFQPAEEGVRGAKSMVEAGVLQGVDYVLACHIMANEPFGKLICGANGFMATAKMDVRFKGKAAHAGATPNEGNHAILAACSAVLNLHAIPRHSAGETRINVGTIVAGTDRNVIPDEARLKIETRGANTAINAYVKDYAYQVIKHAGLMHQVETEIEVVGEAVGGKSDEQLIDIIGSVAKRLNVFDEIVASDDHAGGSEDFTYMMSAVQAQGGKAAFFMVGASPDGTGGIGHHTSNFDFKEDALVESIKLFTGIVLSLL